MNIDNEIWFIKDGKLFKYKGCENEIVIPEGVKIIADRVFKGKHLKKVSFPSTLEKISFDAFTDNELEEVTIPEGVKIIESDAFSHCNLKKVTLPSSIKEISYSAFYDNKLEEVNIPKGVRVINEYTFKNNHLKKVTFSSSIEEISYSAFADNELEEVIIPEGVKIIRRCAFKYNRLKEIIFPSTLELIGTGAFFNSEWEESETSDDCNNFIKIWFPSKKIDIEEAAFIFKNKKMCLIFQTINEDVICIISKIKRKCNCNITKIIIYDKNVSLKYKLKIKAIIPHIDVEYLDPKEKTQSHNNSFNDEIENLINNIYNSINNLPINIQKSIINRIDKLLSEYEKNYNQIEPKLSLNDNDFSFSNVSVETLKNNLIIELNKIITNLNSQKKYINLSEKIEEYKQIMVSNIDKLPKNKKGIDYMIKYITYVSNVFNDDNIMIKLRNIIDNINDKLNHYLNDDFNLSIDGNLEVKLYLQIVSLYTEVFKLYDSKLQNYLSLKNILKQLNNSIKLLNNNSNIKIGAIDDFVCEIISYIDTLDITDKTIISNKLLEILNNWINKLNKEGTLVVKDFPKEIILSDDYIKIQIMILKDLYSIKYKIDDYLNKKKKHMAYKLVK